MNDPIPPKHGWSDDDAPAHEVFFIVLGIAITIFGAAWIALMLAL